MTPSNQTRRRAAKAALIAALFAAVAVLGEIASLASKLPGGGTATVAVLAVAVACGTGLHHRPARQTAPLPRPLDAGLPAPARDMPTLAA